MDGLEREMRRESGTCVSHSLGGISFFSVRDSPSLRHILRLLTFSFKIFEARNGFATRRFETWILS